MTMVSIQLMSDSIVTMYIFLAKKICSPLPNVSDVFESIKNKFDISFGKIQEAIISSPPPIDELQRFLANSYNYIHPQVAHFISVNEILTVLRDHCTLIDVSCLEGIVEQFHIEEAKIHIRAFRDVIQLFCAETKISLCLGECFEVRKTPLLRCETATFVLKWKGDDYTLADVNEILQESLEGKVQIRHLRQSDDDDSITITCFFPHVLTFVLIAKAQENIELVKKKGLIQLVVGHCIIYDHRRDKVRNE